MNSEIILADRGSLLRKNNSLKLKVSIIQKYLKKIFLINGTSFLTQNVVNSDLIVKPNDYYMIINSAEEDIEIKYNQDISNHEIIYDPYKFENSEKTNFKPETFKKKYNVPNGYIDTLPKWYSFKFTYPDYNLIFVRPEMGLSIQTHKFRNEFWEILKGNPIIINGNKVHYYVKKGTKFQNSIDIYHSVINPNKGPESFIVLKEKWSGKFDENDILRVFNPNKYK